MQGRWVVLVGLAFGCGGKVEADDLPVEPPPVDEGRVACESIHQAAWGLDNDGYGTYRHALFLLYGRLELSENAPPNPGALLNEPSLKDPACHGLRSYLVTPPVERAEDERDLFDGLPSEFSVRWQRPIPEHSDEALAGELFSSAGMVLEDIPSTDGPWEAIADLLVERLARQEAEVEGVPYEGSTFDSGERGRELAALVDRLGPSSLAFGASHARFLYHMVTGTSFQQLLDQAEDARRGIERDGEALPVDGDVDVRFYVGMETWPDESLDSAAHLGKAQWAYQCPLEPHQAPLREEEAGRDLYSRAFDSIAGLASTVADGIVEFEDADDAQDESAEVLEGLRSLAGTDVIVQIEEGGEVTLRLMRPDAVDLQRLAVAAAPAWEVECLIGQRETCPQRATIEPFVAEGADGDLLIFSGPSMDSAEEDDLYVVELPEGNESGRIIATLPYQQGRFRAQFSEFRRETVERMLSFEQGVCR